MCILMVFWDYAAFSVRSMLGCFGVPDFVCYVVRTAFGRCLLFCLPEGSTSSGMYIKACFSAWITSSA